MTQHPKFPFNRKFTSFFFFLVSTSFLFFLFYVPFSTLVLIWFVIITITNPNNGFHRKTKTERTKAIALCDKALNRKSESSRGGPLKEEVDLILHFISSLWRLFGGPRVSEREKPIVVHRKKEPILCNVEIGYSYGPIHTLNRGFKEIKVGLLEAI